VLSKTPVHVLTGYAELPRRGRDVEENLANSLAATQKRKRSQSDQAAAGTNPGMPEKHLCGHGGTNVV
jgi:hypothetical protein